MGDHSNVGRQQTLTSVTDRGKKATSQDTGDRREKRPASSERQHFATLDGLRGIAAIVVVIFHDLSPFDLDSLIPHAPLAVDFFFCLSGFVVAYAYEKRLLGTMSFTDFVAVRIIRLYPLILAGLLLGAAVFVLRAELLHHEFAFTPNFFIVLILEALSLPCPPILGEAWPVLMPIDPPAWSLFFEFLASFLFAAFVSRLSKSVTTILLIFGAIIVFGQAGILGGVRGGNSWAALWGGFGRVFFPFLCGVFLYRNWKISPAGGGKAKCSLIVPISLVVLLLCPVPSSANWIYESLAVVVGFPLIIRAGALDAPGPRMTSFYLFLGRLSYPLYILHYPLIRIFGSFARAHDIHSIGIILLSAAELLSAVGLSLLILKFYDEPVRAWLTRRWRSLRAT